MVPPAYGLPVECLSKTALSVVSTVYLELLVMGVPHRQSLIRFPVSRHRIPEAIGYSDTSL